MKQIYKGRKYKVFGECELPKKEGDYLYFIRIGDAENRLFKIGTTNRPLERMLEHCKTYQEEI